MDYHGNDDGLISGRGRSASEEPAGSAAGSRCEVHVFIYIFFFCSPFVISIRLNCHWFPQPLRRPGDADLSQLKSFYRHCSIECRSFK